MSYYSYEKNNSLGCGGFIAIIIIFILCMLGSCSIKESNERTVNVTVTDKGIKNYDDKSKYLIYCKNENEDIQVYEITDSLFQGKFNSSDIYASIEIGKEYTFIIRGTRIGLTSTYPNIVEVTERE